VRPAQPNNLNKIGVSEMATTSQLNEIGKAALESIREMVAALQCDYDRLEELRDEREGYEPEADEDGTPLLDENGAALTWYDANPDDAEELAALESAAGDCTSEDDARERIQEDPLSLRIFGERINGEWEDDRFELLLTTGGPAVRIMGETDGNEPTRAWLEVQDWGTPWTDYYEPGIGEVLLDYCRVFYFE
jgi:hypothetical protein